MYNSQLNTLLEQDTLPLAQLEPFKNSRKRCYERFASEGWPNKKDEDWKYTSLQSFLDQDLQPLDQTQSSHSKPDLENYKNFFNLIKDDYRLVFEEGIFSEENSVLPQEKGITAKTWKDIAESDLEKMQQNGWDPKNSFCSQSPLGRKQPFTHLNCAFFTDGLFLSVDPKTQIKTPIHIVYLNHPTEKTGHSKNIILLGDGAELIVSETHLSTDRTGASNVSTDFYLSTQSQLHCLNIQRQSKKSYHFGHTRFFQKRHSQVNSFFLACGAELSRQDVECFHKEDEAHTTLNGAILGDQSQLIDIHTNISHEKEQGRSQQIFKSILSDKAQGVFNGRIYIAPQAQKVNSHLLNKTLLLGQDSQMNTKPELEIFADDVKAAHGATIGRINKDEVFYLLSRGIDKKTALQMLVEAYAKGEAYKLISPLKDIALQQIDEALRGFSYEF